MVDSDQPERNRIPLDPRVYAQQGVIALLTVFTMNRRPVFADDEAAGTVVEELRTQHNESRRVLGFSVMPDHVHILIMNVDDSLVDFIRAFKGRIAAKLRKTGIRSLWQRSFHDHILRRNEDINRTILYLLENPVRSGLVDHWKHYPWCGSLQWPEIDEGFFASNPSDVIWSEIFALEHGRG